MSSADESSTMINSLTGRWAKTFSTIRATVTASLNTGITTDAHGGKSAFDTGAAFCEGNIIRDMMQVTALFSS